MQKSSKYRDKSKAKKGLRILASIIAKEIINHGLKIRRNGLRPFQPEAKNHLKLK